MGQLRGAGFGLSYVSGSVGAVFGGLGGGRGEGNRLVWNPALLGLRSAGVEEAGGCRTLGFSRFLVLGRKIGAPALGRGLGQKGQGRLAGI